MLLTEIPIFYINLEDDIARNTYMKDHLNDLGLHNNLRISGINGKYVANGPSNMSYQEVGCTLSHIKAIESFIKTGSEFAIISEDDSDFSNILNLSFSLESICPDAEDDYCLQTAVLSRIDMGINFDIHKRSFWDFGTSSYIINKKYAKKLINFYGTHDNLMWDKFVSKQIIDPRGGIVHTRPVADEIIYSLCNALVYPIFSFVNFSSTVNNVEEQNMQIQYSIEAFRKNWG